MNGYCQISIYKDCKILPNKNFKVDDIDDYLSTLTTFPSDHVLLGQFMKHQFSLTYKIEIGQLNLNYGSDWNLNYLKAINVDRSAPPIPSRYLFRPVYYFIKGKRWLGENCIELELEMDVINTLLRHDVNDEDLALSDKTYILREHKNRWSKDSFNEHFYYPEIDYISEGFNPLLFKKIEHPYYHYLTQDMESDDRSYYLIFRSHSTDENSPIDIMCCSDSPLDIEDGVIGYTGTKDVKKSIKELKAWYIYGNDGTGGHTNSGATISFKDKTGNHTITLSANSLIVIGWKNIVYGTLTSNGFIVSQNYEPRWGHNYRDVEFRRIYACRIGDYIPPTTPSGGTIHDVTTTSVLTYPLDSSFDTTQHDYVIGAIDDIDRTDPKLLKIIKLPYPPFNIQFNNEGVITTPAGWEVREAEVDSQQSIIFPEILLYSDKSLTRAFTYTFTPRITTNINFVRNPTSILNPHEIVEFGSSNAPRNIDYETKLLHSDFYNQKIVYDSFAYNVNLELLSNSVEFNFEFSVTATMNSKMMIRFTGLTDTTNFKDVVGDTQDYSGILYIARNNELPIFNSAYLQYIRTGYNYDVKTKNRQLASNIIGGVLTTTGAVVSAVAGGPVGIAGAIGLGIGAVSNFTRAIFNTAQSEQNIAQKLKSSELEGLSIIGSDDVDLMSIYTNENKAKYVRYEVSDRMKNALYNLFFYCGYNANYYGDPLGKINANENKRMWFNFIQCNPVYNYVKNFPAEIVDKLTEKFENGITILHNHATYISGVNYEDYWDFEQQYENWETSLL